MQPGGGAEDGRLASVCHVQIELCHAQQHEAAEQPRVDESVEAVEQCHVEPEALEAQSPSQQVPVGPLVRAAQKDVSEHSL